MIDIGEMKSLGSFDDAAAKLAEELQSFGNAAAKAKEEAEQGKPKPIHFRPTQHDQWLIDQLRGDVDVDTSAGIIRYALEMAVAHRSFVRLMQGDNPLWHGNPEAKGTFEGIASMVGGECSEQ